ncbi:MAG: hypothetical protein O2960_19820 [Verrucomicrobia bacterium]|nr:hypothetical protein [Verrucomicrobiota bacterium]
MNERNFSKHRRGSMRFRPSGGISTGPNKPDRAAVEARAHALTEKPVEEQVFDVAKHQREIERSENVAAGLPPDAKTEQAPNPRRGGRSRRGNFRQQNANTPAKVAEEPKFKPVLLKEPPPKTIVDSIRQAATKDQKSAAVHQTEEEPPQGSYHQRGISGNPRRGS